MDYQIFAYVTAVLALVAGILSLEYFRDYKASVKWYEAYPIKHRELRMRTLRYDYLTCVFWCCTWSILTCAIWWLV